MRWIAPLQAQQDACSRQIHAGRGAGRPHEKRVHVVAGTTPPPSTNRIEGGPGDCRVSEKWVRERAGFASLVFFVLFVPGAGLSGFVLKSGPEDLSSGVPDKDLRYEDFQVTPEGFIAG